MKKSISILLSAVMAVGLAACGQAESSSAEVLPTMVDDKDYVLTPDTVAALPEGSSRKSVALAVDARGVEDGARNEAMWRGVTTFCEQFGVENGGRFAAEDESTEAIERALRDAAESGAELVVCAGDEMASALYHVQESYPTVSYLILDDEPHSDDYVTYRTASNVHCVLFRQEQAAFLAGYAAVTEGITELGFMGNTMLPQVVRYCTGFLQGAEAAAEQAGVQVHLKTWYSGTEGPDLEIEDRMNGWYYKGTGVVLVAGETLLENTLTAASNNGGRVMGTETDRSNWGELILGSAVQRYNTVVQHQLYDFYQMGARWDEEHGGKTERVGVTEQAVGLSMQPWNYTRFTLDDYIKLYDRLRTSAIKVERYSDAATLPETPNVTVESYN